MSNDEAELASLTARLERLEKRTRVWRAVGIGALALVAIGALQQRPAPNVVEAKQFVVRDSEGIARATLDGTGLVLRDARGIVRIELQESRLGQNPIALGRGDADWLKMYSVGGQPTVELTDGVPSPDFLQGITKENSSANLVLLHYGRNAESVSAANLGVGSATGLWLTKTRLENGTSWPKSSDTETSMAIDGGAGGFSVKEGDRYRIGLFAKAGQPGLELTDAAGYAAQIGASELVYPHSGTKQQTSAASILLFDKNMHVIWRAPNP